MNIINPIFALVTVALGRNILYADGSRKTLLGRIKKGSPAAAPDDAHEKAMAALEEMRKAQ